MTPFSARIFFFSVTAFMKPFVSDVAHALGTAHGDGFQVLTAGHSANTGATGGAVQVIHDCREQHLVFARPADAGDASERVLQRLLQCLFRLPDALAPQVTGIAQLGGVVVDVQVDRLRRLASKMIMSQPAILSSAPQ